MDFHGQMVNIPIDQKKMDEATRSPGHGNLAELAYKMGHLAARHAAAEIANEGDQRIRELEARVGRLEAANTEISESRDEALAMLEKVADDRDRLARENGSLQAERDEARETLSAASGYEPDDYDFVDGHEMGQA
jgi:chromosome segregation ATPase